MLLIGHFLTFADFCVQNILYGTLISDLCINQTNISFAFGAGPQTIPGNASEMDCSGSMYVMYLKRTERNRELNWNNKRRTTRIIHCERREEMRVQFSTYICVR